MLDLIQRKELEKRRETIVSELACSENRDTYMLKELLAEKIYIDEMLADESKETAIILAAAKKHWEKRKRPFLNEIKEEVKEMQEEKKNHFDYEINPECCADDDEFNMASEAISKYLQGHQNENGWKWDFKVADISYPALKNIYTYIAVIRWSCSCCGTECRILPQNNTPGIARSKIPMDLLCDKCQKEKYSHCGYTTIVRASYSLKELKDMPYSEYLQTEHWQKVRESTLRRAGYRCQLCSSKDNLNGHHNSYENRGEELPEDTIALCNECHKKHHGVNNSLSENHDIIIILLKEIIKACSEVLKRIEPEQNEESKNA